MRERAIRRRLSRSVVCGNEEDALAGVGGALGMKNEGMAATLDKIAVKSTMFGTSAALLTKNGFTSCPSAPPSGFARLAAAVAEMRPASVNQRSE